MSRLCEICGNKILCPDPVNPHLCSECGQDIGALRFWEELVENDEDDYLIEGFIDDGGDDALL